MEPGGTWLSMLGHDTDWSVLTKQLWFALIPLHLFKKLKKKKVGSQPGLALTFTTKVTSSKSHSISEPRFPHP